MSEDVDIMITELLTQGKQLCEEESRMALLAVLDDLSENGKKDVTITELWFKLHRLKLEALQIENLLDCMGFKIGEAPSELSSLTVRVVQANSSLLKEWGERTRFVEKKLELLRKAEDRVRLRQEGAEPLKHAPRWHYKVVLDMLDKVSKHGQKDVTYYDYKTKLDWILKLDHFELLEMLKEMGFRIKKGLLAIEIIEANAPLLKEWRSKKMAWWKER